MSYSVEKAFVVLLTATVVFAISEPSMSYLPVIGLVLSGES
jgi:hypothetical protein